VFDPERLLKQVMNQALSGSLGGKQRRHKSSYGSSGLGGLLGGSSGGSSSGLGSLLGGVMGGSSGRGSGMSTATKAKIGLGALGLAIAAYEHYKTKQGPAATSNAPPPAPAYGAAPPPPPPATASAPPPAPAASNPAQAEEAMHLLRAMVCAANADGLIDADERQRILGSAREAGLDAEDLAALEGELAAPLTVAQLVARTRPPQREQVYVASVIAIGRDTDLEVRYLDDLAKALGIDAAARDQLHAELGL
jgi:uncharacterized membrane protein YebE (DUF533 family)